MAVNTSDSFIFTGTVNLAGATVFLPAGAVTNAAVAASAGIDYDKLDHFFKKGTSFDLAIGGTSANYEEIVFVPQAAGIIRAFHATMNTTGSTGNSDYTLKVNGSSVLSAAVNIANTDANKIVKDGTINSSALVIDDIVSIQITRNSSHDGVGPFGWVEISMATPA